jgi:hypothetical protein
MSDLPELDATTYAHVLAEAERAAHNAFDQPRDGRHPLDEALNVYRMMLTQAGILRRVGDPDRIEIEHAARYLADKSGNRRYTGADGWRRLLQSEANIHHAYTAAALRHEPREGVRVAMANARDVLIRAVKSGSDEP